MLEFKDKLISSINNLTNTETEIQNILNKQEELINKIKEIIEETKYHDDYYENNCEIEKEKLKNILDLIKEYEE